MATGGVTLSYLKNVGLDEKKIYTLQKWTEQFRNYTKESMKAMSNRVIRTEYYHFRAGPLKRRSYGKLFHGERRLKHHSWTFRHLPWQANANLQGALHAKRTTYYNWGHFFWRKRNRKTALELVDMARNRDDDQTG